MPEIVPSTVSEPATGVPGDPHQDVRDPAVGSRPWTPPAFSEVELAAEVTAYAGRW
ncbi:pyrroloquinoline quinone precursor peptide PqqA [Streptomyces sp. NPDC037389]|uniref:pyrroloquinoline quinone precursor peptide PqqA n=1 Tax=Streptomyces sp. NPDC037389 TaxID=3155369 RepID=UPI0033D5BCA9